MNCQNQPWENAATRETKLSEMCARSLQTGTVSRPTGMHSSASSFCPHTSAGIYGLPFQNKGSRLSTLIKKPHSSLCGSSFNIAYHVIKINVAAPVVHTLRTFLSELLPLVMGLLARIYLSSS